MELLSSPVMSVWYSSIPGHRKWQIEPAAWNLDVRLDQKEKISMHAEKYLLRNTLAGSFR